MPEGRIFVWTFMVFDIVKREKHETLLRIVPSGGRPGLASRHGFGATRAVRGAGQRKQSFQVYALTEVSCRRTEIRHQSDLVAGLAPGAD